MITVNSRRLDREDAALLFASIIQYGLANQDRLDRSIMSLGYANLLSAATDAARLIAEQHVDCGGEWDGCLWVEHLEDIGPDSLAAALYVEEPDISAVVTRWLDLKRL